jgi:LEA14-like dessication related protein
MRRLLLPALFALSSCAILQELLSSGGFQKPSLQFKTARITEASLADVTLETVWELDNPNPVGISLSKADYALFVEGKQVVAGSPPVGLRIAASGKSELVFPANIKFRDVFPAIGAVISKDRAKYQVKGDLGVDSPIGPIEFPLTYSGEVEVPKVPKVHFETPRVQVSLVGARVDLPMVVTNRNSFALPLQNIGGAVTIAGARVGTVSTGDLGRLEPNGVRKITLPLTLDFAQGAQVAEAALQGRQLDVHFAAELQSGTERVPIDVAQALSFVR